MKILIIGADGYMGWPLTCQLAGCEDTSKLVLLDNCITREKVRLVGGASVTPIKSFFERGELLKNAYPKKAIEFIKGTVLDAKLVKDLSKERFDVIYHLGHLRTAPYSMSSQEACIETVQNNEIGFLNLIWSLKENSKDTHVIKLGSFGAYAPTGLKIPENDIIIQSDTGNSSNTVPYPKFATDFYHITKANDSLFARAACKNWSLNITDVMQSTVFGCYNRFTAALNEPTRVDYDEIYGTVVNRFLIQAMLGMKMSVYGDGEHSSGIMVLEDSINVLCALRNEKKIKGEYTPINNNPRSYTIIELANIVKSVLSKKGINAEVSINEFDPRHEKISKGNYQITTAENKYFNENFIETDIKKEISRSYEILKDNLSGLSQDVIYPQLDWAR